MAAFGFDLLGHLCGDMLHPTPPIWCLINLPCFTSKTPCGRTLPHPLHLPPALPTPGTSEVAPSPIALPYNRERQLCPSVWSTGGPVERAPHPPSVTKRVDHPVVRTQLSAPTKHTVSSAKRAKWEILSAVFSAALPFQLLASTPVATSCLTRIRPLQPLLAISCHVRLKVLAHRHLAAKQACKKHRQPPCTEHTASASVGYNDSLR